jgi:hypothetical protein
MRLSGFSGKFSMRTALVLGKWMNLVCTYDGTEMTNRNGYLFVRGRISEYTAESDTGRYVSTYFSNPHYLRSSHIPSSSGTLLRTRQDLSFKFTHPED